MKKLLFASFLTIIYTLSANTAGAQMTIRGRITADDTKENLEFVNVSIKGLTKGTASNFEGMYEIIADPSDIVQFSYLGYQHHEVLARDLAKNPDVELKSLSMSLQELIVKAFQEEDVIRGCLADIERIYPSDPVLCKAQIKDITLEDRKIQSYYDFASDIWVKSFNAQAEERDPNVMRVLNVVAATDRYSDSVPARPYVIYDKTVRNIIPENYALRSILNMIGNNLLKWQSTKEELGGEEVWVMKFESKNPQNDTRSQASIDNVSGVVIAAVADSAILRVELVENFSNYFSISHLIDQKNNQRIQCTVNYLQQEQTTSFRRVGRKVYPTSAKTTISSELKYSGLTVKRQQLSLILIGEIVTRNVKRIPRKEAYRNEMPLYRQVTVGNESWRTLNSLPLTTEERAFVDEYR